MNLTITARHCELSNEEKIFIEERVNSLLRFYNRIMEAHVTVIEEKHRLRAEIKVNINHNVLFSEAESTDLHQSVEQVVQRMERQIKKHKGRNRRRSVDKEELASIGREVAISSKDEDMSIESYIDGEIEEMTLSEAVQKVRAGTSTILFKDSTSGRMKTVHRRGDGRIDVLEMGPESDK
jgi:putative sigma-54 modulation protein